MKNIRRFLAKLIYPEIFISQFSALCHLKETEEDLAKAKECLKGKGKLITLDLALPDLKE